MTTGSTGFATRLNNEMVARGIDIHELSQRLNVSYEHCRKFVRGDILPNTNMFLRICKALHLDTREMKPLLIRDKIVMKFGTIPGQDPRFAEVGILLPLLSEIEYRIVLKVIRALAQKSAVDILLEADPLQEIHNEKAGVK
jgi:hypothetical protein